MFPTKKLIFLTQIASKGLSCFRFGENCKLSGIRNYLYTKITEDKYYNSIVSHIMKMRTFDSH